MNISREIKKEEAIKRMKAMGLYYDAIKQFEDEDTVMVSEPPIGGLYWLNEEEKKMVQEFEKEYNALVYLVVRSFTTMGKMDNLFYVGDHKEEWAMDNEDITINHTFAYVVNHDIPEFSEFGTIAFKSVGGGILRKF